MSDTPRTDEVTQAQEFGSLPWSALETLARTLERELAAMRVERIMGAST